MEKFRYYSVNNVKYWSSRSLLSISEAGEDFGGGAGSGSWEMLLDLRRLGSENWLLLGLNLGESESLGLWGSHLDDWLDGGSSLLVLSHKHLLVLASAEVVEAVLPVLVLVDDSVGITDCLLDSDSLSVELLTGGSAVDANISVISKRSHVNW